MTARLADNEGGRRRTPHSPTKASKKQKVTNKKNEGEMSERRGLSPIQEEGASATTIVPNEETRVVNEDDGSTW